MAGVRRRPAPGAALGAGGLARAGHEPQYANDTEAKPEPVKPEYFPAVSHREGNPALIDAIKNANKPVKVDSKGKPREAKPKKPKGEKE